jgi:cytochrome c5
MCHDTGMANAPQPDQTDRWNTRLEEVGGVDGLVQNAISGVNAMPPRGMCTDCTDDEIRQVVEYILRDVL